MFQCQLTKIQFSSCPVELGCVMLPVWMCSPPCKLAEPPTIGTLWMMMGVEGCELPSSYENTKIATNC